MAASPTFVTKVGVTKPIRTQLTDIEGNVIDLTDASVVFYMKSPAGEVKIDGGTVAIITADSGIVEYQWTAADVDTAGEYEGEFWVTDSSGDVGIYPQDGYIGIMILANLAS